MHIHSDAFLIFILWFGCNDVTAILNAANFTLVQLYSESAAIDRMASYK
jgi:hypothetical protein